MLVHCAVEILKVLKQEMFFVNVKTVFVSHVDL